MQAKIDELWPQIHVVVAFLYAILCIITGTTPKLKVVGGCSTHRKIALLSKMSILLELRATYEWWVMDPNRHCNHFPVQHFVCPYTCNSKTTGRMQTFYILNDFSTIGDVYFSVLELNARYKWQGTPSNKHPVSFLWAIFAYTMYLDT